MKTNDVSNLFDDFNSENHWKPMIWGEVGLTN
jgi:hypothetical protein